jgi:hypothetical protein
VLNDYPNFYVDTAARVPEIGRKPAEVRRVIWRTPIVFSLAPTCEIGPGMFGYRRRRGRGPHEADVDHFFSSSWEFFRDGAPKFDHPTPIQKLERSMGSISAARRAREGLPPERREVARAASDAGGGRGARRSRSTTMEIELW